MLGLRQKKRLDLNDLPPFLTVPQAGEILQVDKRTAYYLARDGVIPTVRLGKRRLRVPRDALLAKLQEFGGQSANSPGGGGA